MCNFKTVFLAVVFKIVLILVAQQVAEFAVPVLIIHEEFVGAAGGRIVVNAVIQKDTGSATVDQALQRGGADAFLVRKG